MWEKKGTRGEGDVFFLDDNVTFVLGTKYHASIPSMCLDCCNNPCFQCVLERNVLSNVHIKLANMCF